MNERQLLDILVGFATTLTAEFSIQDVLDQMVAQMVELLPVTGAGLVLMDGTGDRHVIVAAANVAGPGAVFSFPLRHAGIRLGALELYGDDPVDLSPAELGSGQALVDVVASYLLIARRRDQAIAKAQGLSDAALHDHLTGLPNRRLLRDRLEQATDRSQRTGVPFAVLFCDLDDFKGANDHFGHQAGDWLLVALTERLRASLRPSDTLARFAGDEFVIICEAMPDLAQAEDVARRTLDVTTQPFMLAGGGVVELHMSIGVALAGVGHATADQALVQADEAMYQAKADGGARFANAIGASTPDHARPGAPLCPATN